MSKLTDKMDFSERVWNSGFYLLNDLVYDHIIWNDLDNYYSDFKSNVLTGTPTSACKMMGKADIWLIRNYWDLNFPYPILPNFKYAVRIHYRPAKPMPHDIEDFVQSSREHGVFTLGSLITNITREKANMIASALAQIPQKVISDKNHKTLHANIRLFYWLPQNDLLGEFSANGIYEAIYHSVPMVGIPMFADQPANMVHMKARGAARIVDLNFNKQKTSTNRDYKENAMRLSRTHHDRPMSPCDKAIFWIQYTIRNKGAKHLRVQAHELTWYQYHSLDVLVFLLSVVLLVNVLFIKTFSFCSRRCCGSKRKRKTA
uniref:Glucuronosyltransferase n=1 Tax=Cynoglossus semilaevis TaxID=244447 RepID=A0A3P8W6E0_CYNSE